MFEMVKDKIWNLLREKEVSLAMIYDRETRILWHKGRSIRGKDVRTGSGFCKSYIKESLERFRSIECEDYISSNPGMLSQSAIQLVLKSVIIHPINQKFFLYVDSGRKECFTESDRASISILGELLKQVILQVGKDAHISGISGDSIMIKEIRDQIVKYSIEEEPILISGETGVGKNHIAALIHQYSGKKGKFVVVDTPNIIDNLFESKLFGHKKGAFTDAKFQKTGLVEEAADGTLFFDEITEVPLEVQAKLLHFMDTKKFYTLGESTEKEADVRIIAATNKNLQQAVVDKEFREDLYYRLNVLEIQVPPLRLRKDDIRKLVMENLSLLRGKEIGKGFWETLYEYRWPGNVRELLNILKRAGIMLESPITGEKIFSLIHINGKEKECSVMSEGRGDEILEETREKVKSGFNFWQLIWGPFIDREMDRTTVKHILKFFYTESFFNFRQMIRKLNLAEREYPKFMSLLYKYRIDPRK